MSTITFNVASMRKALAYLAKMCVGDQPESMIVRAHDGVVYLDIRTTPVGRYYFVTVKLPIEGSGEGAKTLAIKKFKKALPNSGQFTIECEPLDVGEFAPPSMPKNGEERHVLPSKLLKPILKKALSCYTHADPINVLRYDSTLLDIKGGTMNVVFTTAIILSNQRVPVNMPDGRYLLRHAMGRAVTLSSRQQEGRIYLSKNDVETSLYFDAVGVQVSTNMPESFPKYESVIPPTPTGDPEVPEKSQDIDVVLSKKDLENALPKARKKDRDGVIAALLFSDNRLRVFKAPLKDAKLQPPVELTTNNKCNAAFYVKPYYLRQILGTIRGKNVRIYHKDRTNKKPIYVRCPVGFKEPKVGGNIGVIMGVVPKSWLLKKLKSADYL